MQRVECNYCHKVESAQGPYNLSPHGWLSVRRQRDPHFVYPDEVQQELSDVHVCGFVCLKAWADRVAPLIAPVDAEQAEKKAAEETARREREREMQIAIEQARGQQATPSLS